MEAFAIGDLHFDGPISRLVENHEKFIVNELNRVAEAARHKGVSHLFLLGDTGHSPRLSYESQLAFIGWLRSVRDLTVHCLLGNHDLFSEHPAAGHSLQIVESLGLPNFRLYTEPTVVKIEGRKVNFLPWPHTSFEKKMLNIAHVELRGSRSDSGRVFKGADLSGGKGYAVIGHLHTNQTVRNSYYPGTLYQTTFGEAEKKYYAHITWEKGSEPEITYVRHKPRVVLRTIVIDEVSALKNIPKDPNILVRLVVADGVDISKAKLTKYPNVVKVRGFTNKADLQAVIAEELADGIDVKFRTYDFLKQFLRLQNVDRGLRKHAMGVWREITGASV